MSSVIDDLLYVASSRQPGIAEERVVDYLVETNAGSVAGAQSDWVEPFDRLLDVVSSRIDSGPSVYLDTTTIWSADRLVQGDSEILTGFTLADLDKLTRSIVLNDHVFHMPSEHIDPGSLNAALGEKVLVPLEPIGTSEALNVTLWHLWTNAASVASEGRFRTAVGSDSRSSRPSRSVDAEQLFKGVESLYGIELTSGDRSVESYGGSTTFSSVPSVLVRNLLESDEEAVSRMETLHVARRFQEGSDFYQDRVQIAKELVHRATFNCMLADSLGLMYDPSFLRVPSILHLLENSAQIAMVTAEFDQVEALADMKFAEVSQELADAVAGALPMPPFTAYALAKCDRLDQWWEVVASLRDSSRRYRRIRRDIQQGLLEGDVDLVRRLRRDLQAGSKKQADDMAKVAIEGAVQTASVGAAAFTGAAVPATLITPLILALQHTLGRPTSRAISALRRRLRPEIRLFADVAETASSILNHEAKITMLWNTTTIRASVSELSELLPASTDR